MPVLNFVVKARRITVKQHNVTAVTLPKGIF